MASLATWRHRTRRELVAAGLVAVGLTAFVVCTYVVVVLGVGALVGRTSSPDLFLSVVATALVAVAFDPVETVLERAAARLVYGGATPPYDVWDQFSTTIGGTYPAEELPVRMARVLAEATGARATEVWLTGADGPTLAATWPRGAAPGTEGDPGRRALEVRYAGEPLGVLVVQERARLTAVEERLFTGLADQAGLVLRGARLRTELERRAEELSRRAEELRHSRRRLVDLQDERRRALERDIHDGAQQHLVALSVNLRLAQTVAARSPARAQELLDAQKGATAAAIETLLQLSRGIYPPLLASQGLQAAVESAAATSPVPVELSVREVGRYAAHVEAAAYFTCLEAVQNAVKHSGARSIQVDLVGDGPTLTVTVADDGRGFDAGTAAAGAGLTNLRDRVESVGGTLVTQSTRGHGTRVRAVLPVGAAADLAGAS